MLFVPTAQVGVAHTHQRATRPLETSAGLQALHPAYLRRLLVWVKCPTLLPAENCRSACCRNLSTSKVGGRQLGAGSATLIKIYLRLLL